MDLVYLPGFINNLEVIWDNPLLSKFLNRLSTSCRLIMIDRRGALHFSPTGCRPTTSRLSRISPTMSTWSSTGLARSELLVLWIVRLRLVVRDVCRDAPGAHVRADPVCDVGARIAGLGLSVHLDRRRVGPLPRGIKGWMGNFPRSTHGSRYLSSTPPSWVMSRWPLGMRPSRDSPRAPHPPRPSSASTTSWTSARSFPPSVSRL